MIVSGHATYTYRVFQEKEVYRKENETLKQQLSRAQADLELAVKMIERVLLNMEQESPSYQYCYDLLFETYETLKQIKEKKGDEN